MKKKSETPKKSVKKQKKSPRIGKKTESKKIWSEILKYGPDRRDSDWEGSLLEDMGLPSYPPEVILLHVDKEWALFSKKIDVDIKRVNSQNDFQHSDHTIHRVYNIIFILSLIPFSKVIELLPDSYDYIPIFEVTTPRQVHDIVYNVEDFEGRFMVECYA